jgi:hypothetical protein
MAGLPPRQGISIKNVAADVEKKERIRPGGMLEK